MNKILPKLKQYAPATQKNRQSILEVLQKVLPNDGSILEIASGTGEHSIFFAPHFSPRKWIPSDVNIASLNSISAWLDDCHIDNIEQPLLIDISTESWLNKYQYLWQNEPKITAIININMIHISPWQSCLGLMNSARQILSKDGILYLYGAFKIDNKHTALSNEIFDQSLRSQNSQWGVRNLQDVIEVAKNNGLICIEIIEMPSNNLSVIFKRNDHK